MTTHSVLSWKDINNCAYRPLNAFDFRDAASSLNRRIQFWFKLLTKENYIASIPESHALSFLSSTHLHAYFLPWKILYILHWTPTIPLYLSWHYATLCSNLASSIQCAGNAAVYRESTLWTLRVKNKVPPGKHKPSSKCRHVSQKSFVFFVAEILGQLLPISQLLQLSRSL